MENFNIYLAGGMGAFGKERFNESNEWRLYVKDILESADSKYKVECCNPNDYFNFVADPPEYETEREVVEFDLGKVRKSNLIIVNFNDPKSLGTMAEIAIAYEKRIPVIGLNEKGENLHPWQKEMTNRVFSEIDEMLAYINRCYI